MVPQAGALGEVWGHGHGCGYGETHGGGCVDGRGYVGRNSAPRLRARAVGALAVLGLLTIAGCSGPSTRAAWGPLGKTVPVDGAECVPAPVGSLVTLGAEALANHGSTPVTLDSVALVGARGLRVVDAEIVPIANTTLIGVGPGYPPTWAITRPAEAAVWARRAPVSHAVIPAGSDRNLVLGVRYVDSATGTADRMEVT